MAKIWISPNIDKIFPIQLQRNRSVWCNHNVSTFQKHRESKQWILIFYMPYFKIHVICWHKIENAQFILFRFFFLNWNSMGPYHLDEWLVTPWVVKSSRPNNRDRVINVSMNGDKRTTTLDIIIFHSKKSQDRKQISYENL